MLGAGDLYLNAIRRFGPARYGESGSPVINFYGEVIGIDVGIFQDIDDVLDSIDNLEWKLAGTKSQEAYYRLEN